MLNHKIQRDPDAQRLPCTLNWSEMQAAPASPKPFQNSKPLRVEAQRTTIALYIAQLLNGIGVHSNVSLKTRVLMVNGWIMQAVLVITMVVRSCLLPRFVLLALLCFVRAVLPASVFRDFLLSCVALLRRALAALRGMRCSFARIRRSVIRLGSSLSLLRDNAR